MKLGNKLSVLAKQALKDLELIEKDKRYVVNLGNWHDSKIKIRDKLYAINHLQCGEINSAFFRLYPSKNFPINVLTQWEVENDNMWNIRVNNINKWKKEFRKMIKYLENEGL